MQWRVLAGLLGVILLAAVVYSVVGGRVETPAPAQPPLAPPTTTAPPTAAPTTAERERPPPAALPRPVAPAGVVSPAPAPPAPTASPPSSDRGATGGLAGASGRASAEPGGDVDAGVPFKLNKDGIKAAIGEKVPELKECYSSWLEANPTLAGKMKVSFTIDTVPETGLGGVTQIEIADGGIDHFAMQGCVMNVFKDLRFEAPENGPLKVNYPLAFATSDAG